MSRRRGQVRPKFSKILDLVRGEMEARDCSISDAAAAVVDDLNLPDGLNISKIEDRLQKRLIEARGSLASNPTATDNAKPEGAVNRRTTNPAFVARLRSTAAPKC